MRMKSEELQQQLKGKLASRRLRPTDLKGSQKMVMAIPSRQDFTDVNVYFISKTRLKIIQAICTIFEK